MGKLPTLSRLEVLVLKMLIERSDLYGLQMVEQSDGHLKRGTIYVMLGRMEDKGFIESREEAQAPGAVGLPRRLYKITGFGQNVLTAWQGFHRVLAGAAS
jgi:DNA-binding PadR family transcriptional regulator